MTRKEEALKTLHEAMTAVMNDEADCVMVVLENSSKLNWMRVGLSDQHPNKAMWKNIFRAKTPFDPIQIQAWRNQLANIGQESILQLPTSMEANAMTSATKMTGGEAKEIQT